MHSSQVYSITKDFIKLNVLIKPQAKQNQIIGIMNAKLKIAITASPINGKANKELINFFAEYFKIKKNAVTILVGANTTSKVLSLPLSTKNTLNTLIEFHGN